MVDSKIRILHVGLDTYLGGIETYLLKITNQIDREHYQFDFLMYDGERPCLYDELTKLGCRFYSVTSRRKSYFQNKKDLKKLFAVEKFDIVHCSFNSLSYIEPALAALRAGCKVIVHSHNAGCLASFKSKILHKINYLRLPKKQITCVAVSDLAGQWMFGKKSKYTVLNNGVDTKKFQFNKVARDKIRKEFQLDDNELIIHVGAFRTQKNHDFIVKVFNKYHKEFPSAKLMLVGTGSRLEEIKKLINELNLEPHIILTGLRDDIPDLMSAADKFLLPSFYEGFPNVLIEAETSGLYCVISDVITKQAVVDGQCVSVSLDAPLSMWVQELSKSPQINRENCPNIIHNMGLDIEQEIERLTSVYSGEYVV